MWHFRLGSLVNLTDDSFIVLSALESYHIIIFLWKWTISLYCVHKSMNTKNAPEIKRFYWICFDYRIGIVWIFVYSSRHWKKKLNLWWIKKKLLNGFQSVNSYQNVISHSATASQLLHCFKQKYDANARSKSKWSIN